MLRTLGTLALATLIASATFAADDAEPAKKKGKRGQRDRNAATQMIKQLEAVALTDEQTEKIKALGKKAADEMRTIREEGGITQELMKKRVAAQKALKDSGKKGKELVAAVNKEAGISEAQVAVLAKANAVRMKFQKDALALLSDEQKEKLPQRLKQAGKRGQRGKAAKKKKDAA